MRSTNLMYKMNSLTLYFVISLSLLLATWLEKRVSGINCGFSLLLLSFLLRSLLSWGQLPFRGSGVFLLQYGLGLELLQSAKYLHTPKTQWTSCSVLYSLCKSLNPHANKSGQLHSQAGPEGGQIKGDGFSPQQCPCPSATQQKCPVTHLHANQVLQYKKKSSRSNFSNFINFFPLSSCIWGRSLYIPWSPSKLRQGRRRKDETQVRKICYIISRSNQILCSNDLRTFMRL